MQVKEIMEYDLTAIGDDDSIVTAIEILMVNSKLGLPVVDNQGHVVGFLNEKDIITAALPGYLGHLDDKYLLPDIKKLRSRLHNIFEDPVGKHMSKNVIMFKETDSILDVLMALNQRNILIASIVDADNYLVGVVNREDTLLKRFIFERLDVE